MTKPLVPCPSCLEVEIVIAKLKKYKSPGSDETQAELIHAGGDKTNCNNYHGISLLSTSYNILSNILLSRLSLYIEEIIWDHQRGF
jgi:hypothetical protein